MSIKKQRFEATVFLKSGGKFTAEWDEDRTFTATSLTESTVHKFVSFDGKRSFFVQGSEIAYVAVR